MAWPEIIATGAVTLVGGLGGVVLTSWYDARQRTAAEGKARIAEENQRLLDLAMAAIEVARAINTLAM